MRDLGSEGRTVTEQIENHRKTHTRKPHALGTRSQSQRNSDFEILKRYSDQPARLPRGLRRRIEDSWHNQPVQLYALADLDASMRFCETWLFLYFTSTSLKISAS